MHTRTSTVSYTCALVLFCRRRLGLVGDEVLPLQKITTLSAIAKRQLPETPMYVCPPPPPRAALCGVLIQCVVDMLSCDH